MMKIIFLNLILLVTLLNADNNIKQQNVLLAKDLVAKEELVAQAFEKYILENYAIPTMDKLKENKYLGEDFSLKNIFGSEDISFSTANSSQLKYSVTKTNLDEYIKLVYDRSLYRKYTEVGADFIQIKLQSDEAKNIYNLLLTNTIESSCPPSTANKYCSVNETSIRWYNSTSNWIEYSKKDFDNGNVTVENTSLLSDTRLEALPVGTYIYLKNGAKYIKLMSSGTLKILKVD